MTTEVEVKDNLNEIVNTFKCEINIDILQSVFTRYRLKEYFIQFCLTVTDKDKLNKEYLPYVALLYEGGYHQHVNEHHMKTLLLYGLFIKSNIDFYFIHNLVKESKRIDEDFYEEVYSLITKKVFSAKHELSTIVKDSKKMFYYYQSSILIEIEDLLREYTHASPNIYSYQVNLSKLYLNMYTDKVFGKIRSTKWLTHWARLKAMKRNWVEIIKKKEISYRAELKLYE